MGLQFVGMFVASFMDDVTCVRDVANRLRLAQVLLRCGQTPFSSFLIWLSAGDLLLPGRKGGGESELYPSFRCKFGGRSLLLCFGVSLREVVFKLVGRPVGKVAASISRGATQTSGYVELGLGTLKFSLDLVFWHTGSPV
jgi:hypothetical protein